LDKGVDEFFSDSEDEVCYAGLRLQPLLFQDDISRLAKDPASLQAGNYRLENMAETKLLDFNLKKSAYMIVGKGKASRRFDEQLQFNPITLCGQPMNCVSESKLLGDWLSDKGNSDCIATTVKKKERDGYCLYI